MNRLQALLLVLIIWAAIFLPGLGSTEIKGEEGRRILPAVTMLEDGDWLVPQIGGKPYLRKPPLINWMIAASFSLSGVRNEWTARLPSALCVLLLAATVVALSTGRGWMNPETGLLAAVFVITQFGLLAKARFAGAEIEGVYVPLSGLAIVTWTAWWCQRRSPWLTWTVPFVFLGLAALAKGPSLHFLFFYVVVLASLRSTREWRLLWQWPHWVGLLLAASIFAAWAVPFFFSPQTAEAANVWKSQGIERFSGSDFDLGSYLLNFPRALMDQMPWVLLLPVLWVAARRSARARPGSAHPLEADSPWMAGVSIALALTALALLLVPGVLPRYLLALGVPFCLLLALALQQGAASQTALLLWHRFNLSLAWLLFPVALLSPIAAGASLSAPSFRDSLLNIDFQLVVLACLPASAVLAISAFLVIRRAIFLRPIQLALHSMAIFAAASLLYGCVATRWINRADDVRPLAAEIDAAVPPGKTLFLYDPGFFSAIFYLRSPYLYAPDLQHLPQDAQFVLARDKNLPAILASRPDLSPSISFSRKGKVIFWLLRPR